MLEILLAVLAGILTIAAPCIILPLPILLGASVGRTDKTRPLFIVLGFVISFTGLALFINWLVQGLGLSANVLRNSAAVLLAIFALFMIWPWPFEWLMFRLSGLLNLAGRAGGRAGQGKAGGLLIGLVIGLVWAPCAGPVLGSILTLIAQQKDLLRAGLLIAAYSIGAGLPMLLIAYGGQALTTKVKLVAKYSQQVQKFFGLIILFTAWAIYFQYDTWLQAKLLEILPVFNSKL
ncbi:MAG: cytochrome c biogenesis CcdA family protein [Patescibacteria group bacterium]